MENNFKPEKEKKSMDKKSEIVELTKGLVRFKSYKSKPDEIEKVTNFAADYLSKYGVVKRFMFNGKPSIVATYNNTKPDIFIIGHLDVVEAPDNNFEPEIKENNLFGRGAVDMKGGDAIAMVLFKDLAKSKPSFGLMLTTDEEIGGNDGAKKLAEKYACKFIIAPEPNHPKEKGQLNITTKHKGFLWLKIKTKGVAAHGSRPWLGDNAADKLIIVYEKIRKKFAKVVPEMWKPTMNLGTIKSGVAPNQIPDSAEAIVDIRWTEDFNKGEFMEQLKGFDAEFEIVEFGPMLDNNEKNKYIELLQACVSKQISKKCLLLKEHGATDLRFFSEKGVPAVVFGPDGAGYHGDNEYLDLNSLEPAYNALKEFILKCKMK